MRHHFLPVLAACLAPFTSEAALVIYYPLDEMVGNVAFDAAVADGIQNATATVALSDWQPSGGIIGGGLRLTPTGQMDVDEALIYSTASTSTSLLSGPPFTITFWFNTTDASEFNRAGVFLGDSTQNSRYYAASINPSHRPFLVARNTTAVETTAPATANDGQWHQLTAVFSATNDRTLYVDGRIAGTSATTVTNMTLNRLGVGALTRLSQTDAFTGLLDEVGLFDTALTREHAALLNAFARYDQVRLDDPAYDLAISVFNNQSGFVETGSLTWTYATGLSGSVGDTGLLSGNPYVVLDDTGNGLAVVPEPSASILALAASLGLTRRRRREARG